MVYQYDGQERIFTGHTGRLFLLLTFIWLCISLTGRLLPPLLPVIIDDLAITAFLAGIALTTGRIIRAGVEYPSGRIADQLSRHTMLLACLSFVIVGLIILSVAFTYAIFVLGVVVAGIGNGLYSPAARALISDMFRQKRGRAFGINMIGSEFAGIFSAGIAILIVGVATWRAMFLPLALLLIPVLVVFHLLCREPVRLEGFELHPLETGIRVFGESSLRWILIVYSAFVFAAAGVSIFLPLFLIEVHGVSFAFASLAFAVLYIAGLVGKPIAGFLSDMFPRLHVAGGSLSVAGFGLTILVVAPMALLAVIGVIIYAFGYRSMPPSLEAYLMDHFSDESMAGDLGAFRTGYMLIGSLGPAYAGLAAHTIGFVATFASFVFLYLAGAMMLLWIARSV